MQKPTEIRFNDLSAELRREVTCHVLFYELLEVDEADSIPAAHNYLKKRNPVVILLEPPFTTHRVVFDDPLDLSVD